MTRPLHAQLLVQARFLAKKDPGRPIQASLRRSVSAAYYALFHFLIDEACRFLIGGSGSDERSLQAILARSFDHSEMAAASRSFGGGTLPSLIQPALAGQSVPSAIVEITGTFLVLQEKRHLADYDLAARFVRQEVVALIDRAESAMAGWAEVRGEPAAKLYLVSLHSWKRLTSRR